MRLFVTLMISLHLIAKRKTTDDNFMLEVITQLRRHL